MWDILDLDHERVDDIPLILGLTTRLKLPDVLDQRLGRHHLHQGLSPGWIATVWIAYILSQSDHRKAAVRDWRAINLRMACRRAKPRNRRRPLRPHRHRHPRKAPAHCGPCGTVSISAACDRLRGYSVTIRQS